AVPAKPGDIITIYATGLGNTNPAYAPGDIASGAATLTGALTVTVGGVSVAASDILYAGAVPQSICGLQQINVRLPASLPAGDRRRAESRGNDGADQEVALLRAQGFQVRDDVGALAGIFRPEGHVGIRLDARGVGEPAVEGRLVPGHRPGAASVDAA